MRRGVNVSPNSARLKDRQLRQMDETYTNCDRHANTRSLKAYIFFAENHAFSEIAETNILFSFKNWLRICRSQKVSTRWQNLVLKFICVRKTTNHFQTKTAWLRIRQSQKVSTRWQNLLKFTGDVQMNFALEYLAGAHLRFYLPVF